MNIEIKNLIQDLEQECNEEPTFTTKGQFTETSKISMDTILDEMDKSLENNKEFVYNNYEHNAFSIEGNLMENNSKEMPVLNKKSKRKKREVGVFFSCKECNHTLASKSGLKQHVLTKHKGIWYHCDRCEYKATTNDYVKRHVQAKHEEAKYQCQECEYKVGTRVGLNLSLIHI